MATFKKLAEFWPYEIMSNLHDAPYEVRVRFAEMFDLYAIIRPDRSQDGYHVDLSADIPLEMEGDKSGAYDMAFGSSGICAVMSTCGRYRLAFSIKRDSLQFS